MLRTTTSPTVTMIAASMTAAMPYTVRDGWVEILATRSVKVLVPKDGRWVPEYHTPSPDVILVDSKDAEMVLAHRWSANWGGGTKYAAATINGRRVSLHRLIMRPPDHLQVDHINGNGLDNRKVNLRLATASQNSANKPARSSSGYKGVYRTTSGGWAAQGKIAGVSTFLGTHDHIQDAARAYDEWAAIAHGEFAVLNFPR